MHIEYLAGVLASFPGLHVQLLSLFVLQAWAWRPGNSGTRLATGVGARDYNVWSRGLGPLGVGQGANVCLCISVILAVEGCI